MERYDSEILHFTSSSSSSGPSTLPPAWPSCQRAPSLSSFALNLWKHRKMPPVNAFFLLHRNISPTWTRRVIRTCPWPRWASLWPGSESPSWSPSERPWTPSCTCASGAPSPSPLWCCHVSSRSPTCQICEAKCTVSKCARFHSVSRWGKSF